MLWSVATLCFFGFLRAGEAVAPSDSGFDPAVDLTYADVRTDSHTQPQMLEVRIKVSKTDPLWKGVNVYMGMTGNELCPVAATLYYIVQRGLGSGPLFLFQDGRYLTRERFVAAVRESLRKAGLDLS